MVVKELFQIIRFRRELEEKSMQITEERGRFKNHLQFEGMKMLNQSQNMQQQAFSCECWYMRDLLREDHRSISSTFTNLS